MHIRCLHLLVFLWLPWCVVAGQPADSLRDAQLRRTLTTLGARDSVFLHEVDVSVGKLPLPELLRNVARASGANLSVRGCTDIQVSCNFARTRVIDLVLFLCREYDLELDVTGNILLIRPAVHAAVPPSPPDVAYIATDTLLRYDLSSVRLIDVARRITDLSGRNIVVPQPLYDTKVSGYVRDMPFDMAMHTLAAVNGLQADRDPEGVWSITRIADPDDGKGHSTAYVRRRRFGDEELKVDSLGRITAHITSGNVQDMILDLCDQQKLNYYFEQPVNLRAGIYVDNTDFETLLSILLKGSPYSYYRERGIYIFGQSDKEGGMSSVRVVPLSFRSVAAVDQIIPKTLAEGLQVQPFPDLNSLILSGDQRRVTRVESFLQSIDRPVPLVTIEIIIADVTKSDIKESGIEMGLGKTGIKTSGTLAPVDMTLNANSINKLIHSFNGFGSVNLGKVSSDFYMSLQFLEENGTVTLQSTPKLSTLNGHEATLTSGEKQYYKEVQNNYYGTQNPIQSEAYTWKSVDANLSVRVIPYVARDNRITLDIEIEQTEFTARETKEAPPGTATRSFKSIVKVENEEMVLLGGIDRNSFEKSSRGIPFLARVPVIKWLFGKSKRNKIDRKLNVFIKPTVIE